MQHVNCILIGAPVDSGKHRKGCVMGPDAYRTANLPQVLSDLGYDVTDLGNLTAVAATAENVPDNPTELSQTIGWTNQLAEAGVAAFKDGIPIFLGGDHALSLGSGLAAARHAQHCGRPLYILWLDAHSDFHTPETTMSGNLHGTPLAYLTGRNGFSGFPQNDAPVPDHQVCILGLRSVDQAEKNALQQSEIQFYDMRAIDEQGIKRPLQSFLDQVKANNGLLHVSLDVDFLDPSVAPAVGTSVPGGATVREAHLVMEILYDSGLMTSLDLVELNPFLDERGRTAQVMVDLAASALGRRVFDRPTHGYF
ncbi:MAG: arginase [Rhodobacteraceae bacterium]|mgnify:FL=1|nr:arginase [Paracoccaceae bacterium]RZO36961.1 MAG: arginase [Paracoccaceae bacterium]|tara:strand:+ start:55 stop:981 length:927 start_codon:yes stop_codon:yes gene_type:complete